MDKYTGMERGKDIEKDGNRDGEGRDRVGVWYEGRDIDEKRTGVGIGIGCLYEVSGLFSTLNHFALSHSCPC
jgi:hypothetical protein